MPKPSSHSEPDAAAPATARPVDPVPLIEQAKAGSAAALGRLLDSYAHYLTLLARMQIGRRVQGKVDPDDVVQETFLEAHRQIARFRGTVEAEFLAWLRVILSGQIAMTLRRYLGTKGRDLKLEREIAGDVDRSSSALGQQLVASVSTPSQHASRREQAVILADALARMPEAYREVIVLRQIEGLPFADVAARMGRTEDSVQKLWVRALAGLRKSMAGGAE
ncbi:MAG TPA: sigma-70 family RNA polymerase sigma factor [Humisphaera sp.]